MTWRGDPVFLFDVIKAEGVSVSNYVGGTDRGAGDMGLLWGTIVHHTGAPVGSTPGPRAIAEHPSLGLASQIYLGRDGKATICGVGIAHHAGAGSWPGLPTNNANPVTIGIEAENSGTEGWSSAQYWAYVKICAAICRKLGVGSDRVIAHKEWAGPAQGKWDPGALDMNKFRADIAAQIVNGNKPQPVRNEIDYVRSFSDWLGKRLHDGEKPCKDGVGVYADFERGSIYHHPKVGTVPVPALVYEVWKRNNWEQGFLGYPTRFHAVVAESEKISGGDIQEFQGGTIARKYGTEGFVVYGKIGERWRADGDVRTDRGAQLGWPTSNEYDYNGGRRQDFEHGSIVWHPTGAVTLIGGK